MNVAELLVHVSGKQQDERYRCMAKAYEDFEIERTVDLTRPEDSDEDVTTTPAAFGRADDAVLAHATSMPSLHVPPGPISHYEAYPPLFSNLSPLFQTAALELDFTATALPTAPETRFSQGESQLRFISDTPLATKALESQLWTSSLALAHEDEAKAFAASLLLSPELEAEGETRHASEDVEAPSSTKDTVVETPSTAVPAIGQLDGAFDDRFTPREQSQSHSSRPSSLKRKRCSEENEGGSRRASGMSLTQEFFGLRPREPSSSPPLPSPVATSTPQSEQDLPFTRPAALPEPVVPPDVAERAHTTSVTSVSRLRKEPAVTTSSKYGPSSQQSRLTVSQLQSDSRRPSPGSSAAKESDIPAKRPTQPSIGNTQAYTVAKAHELATLPAAAPVPTKELPPPIAPFLSHPASHHFIRPPSPPASLAAPLSLASSPSQTLSPNITESLQHLYNKFSPIQPPRYLPIAQTRPLRPLERGYWYLPAPSTTKQWDTSLLQDFWSFLDEFIRGGQAGWGISCVKVPRIPGEDKTVRGAEMIEEDGRRCDVRIYCWGEVVEHVYYLLFVASRSKVKNAGLRWIDGEGKAVLVMPG